MRTTIRSASRPTCRSRRRHDLDRWLVARLNELVVDVTTRLELYDAQNAARAIETFIDELSNWYVRLSRDRFWASGTGAEKNAAYRTLYEALHTLSLLTAPFAPMLAESLYQILVRALDKKAPESVHLAAWPQAQLEREDSALVSAMRVAQKTVDLGRQVRAASKIKTRQPLPVAYVRPRTAAEADALARFRALVLEELNVKDVQIVGLDAEFIEYALRPNLPRLGPRFGKKLGALRQALAAADARAVATTVAQGGKIKVSANGEVFELDPEDVLVDSKSARGYASAESDGMLVALDTRIDEALAQEGLAREIVREIQDARKRAALHISDRIVAKITADEAYAMAIERWRDYISQQTLSDAIEVTRGDALAVTVRKK